MAEADERLMMAPAYTYRAEIVSVYDGDTITVDIDVGFGVWLHGQKIRLYGINAPEVRGDEREAGIRSRDALRQMLPPGRSVVIATRRDKKGKYGRWLGEVYCTIATTPGGPLICANEALVRRGHAKRAEY